jgi:hypothetical protein
MLKVKHVTVIVCGCAILVLAALVMLKDECMEMWYMKTVSTGEDEERRKAISNLVRLSGMRRCPDLIRLWVERMDIEVVMDWDRCVRFLSAEDAKALGFDNRITTEEGIKSGVIVEVSTEGTVYQGHGLTIVNPVALYENRCGLGSWPRDMPIERIRAPKRWKQ